MSENTEITPVINFSQSNPGPSHADVNGGLDLSCTGTASVNKQEESQEPAQQNSTPKKPTNPPNSNNSQSKPKKRKKCLRDSEAPKQPLTGYFRFLNDRREKLRTENPSLQFAEITKQLAAEWNVLPSDQKKQYLDAAEKSSKKSSDGDGAYDIQIFTDQFLDHNKECETHLRQMRKSVTDNESQNAVLQRHVDSLHTAVKQMETDTDHIRETNQGLLRHLDVLRTQLASCFSNIPILGTQGATSDNIDSYMEKLDTLMKSNLDSTQRNALRSAISRVSFSK
ncbi:hypothetical protein QAD02_015969 [Eretmocerus hayati]|uniref:Uncharacterized protein n=1 Tax=Eretmocerus hayati TaxID=131215 RepID=A0ACC2PA51_9HYME|nr:hypothetical protein QAD02_015969 [Eretmocerus hayati]